MKFDEKYNTLFPYYRSINHEDLGYIVKYEDKYIKCKICKTPTEWVSVFFRQPYCSEECLQKDKEVFENENS